MDDWYDSLDFTVFYGDGGVVDEFGFTKEWVEEQLGGQVSQAIIDEATDENGIVIERTLREKILAYATNLDLANEMVDNIKSFSQDLFGSLKYTNFAERAFDFGRQAGEPAWGLLGDIGSNAWNMAQKPYDIGYYLGSNTIPAGLNYLEDYIGQVRDVTETLYNSGYSTGRKYGPAAFNGILNGLIPERALIQRTGADGIGIKYFDINASAVASKGYAKYVAYLPGESKIVFLKSYYGGVESPELETSLGAILIYDSADNSLTKNDILGESIYYKMGVSVGSVGLGINYSQGRNSCIVEKYVSKGISPMAVGGGVGRAEMYIDRIVIPLDPIINEWLRYIFGFSEIYKK